ncbi:MAG: hypothetical protein ACFFDF_22295 [Candidatus Odinarchaeota archaeon]
MTELFKNVEREILEHCYSTIIYLEDYYHEFTISKLKRDKRFKGINDNKILYCINQLIKKNYIEARAPPRNSYFNLSLEGIIFLEKFYLKEQQLFIPLMVTLLDFLRKIEDRIINLDIGEGDQVGVFPIPKFLEIIEIKERTEELKLEFIIDEITQYQKKENYGFPNSFGLAGNKLVFFSDMLLTSKGRRLLNYHEKLKNLFSTIKDKFAKEILLEEYNDIEDLIKREKWKDTFIKMGSILEFLIINYIEDNKLDKNENGTPKIVKILDKKEKQIDLIQADIGHKILFLIQYEEFKKEYNNDLLMYHSLIKEIRNCIHLQKYIKQRIRINKDIFDKLYPVFERLVLLF